MFILLKVLLFFFRPLTWIVLIFLIGLLTRRPWLKWRALLTAFIFLLFFSNPFIINRIANAYQVKPVHLDQQTYGTGILLGGFVTYNPADDSGYFNTASDRFIEAVLLYKKGRIGNLIVAAGNGYVTKNHFREADFVRKRLMETGIPEDCIYIDTSSRNTLENALYTRRIIDSLHTPGPYLLISSSMHLPRAAMVFKKAGIPADLYPCDFETKNMGNNILEDYLFPSARALDLWDGLIKEIAGILTYKITGKA